MMKCMTDWTMRPFGRHADIYINRQSPVELHVCHCGCLWSMCTCEICCKLSNEQQVSRFVNERPLKIMHHFGVIFRWRCSGYSISQEHAHGFVVLCFVVVMQSFIMNSHEVFIHIHQGCFAGTGAIGRLPQCQWSKPDGYGKTVNV